MLLRKVANRILVEGLETTPEKLNNCLLPSERGGNASDSKLLFRFAGDEFVCLITGDMSEEEVSILATRLVEILTRPFLLMDRTIRIGASIGAARIGVDSASAEELIRFADIAMYDAKQNGRGRVSFFDDNMRKAAIDTASLERDFAVAIDRGELEVHYQPKLSLGDNSVTGLEALVRWRHPERGLLYPASFIKIAESGGYLDKLGREVMKTAARDIAAWRSQGHSYRVAINVCPSQFADDMFVTNVTNYVQALGASPSDFELEVTETIAMANHENARSHLINLRNAGFFASIDDFGMGFSNLAQLTRLPYHCLKIDKSLIDDVVQNQDSRTIVSSIIAMAHGPRPGCRRRRRGKPRPDGSARLAGLRYRSGLLHQQTHSLQRSRRQDRQPWGYPKPGEKAHGLCRGKLMTATVLDVICSDQSASTLRPRQSIRSSRYRRQRGRNDGQFRGSAHGR